MDKDRTAFKASLRHGIEASLWEGLPASVGLVLVAGPVAKLVFRHGQTTAHDAELIARSTVIYAGAIWAFSLLQIINRAFYAVHDTTTPLLMSILNIVINLIVELPLLWWMGESAMAVGTLVSFAVQAAVTLWILNRRLGRAGAGCAGSTRRENARRHRRDGRGVRGAAAFAGVSTRRKTVGVGDATGLDAGRRRRRLSGGVCDVGRERIEGSVAEEEMENGKWKMEKVKTRKRSLHTFDFPFYICHLCRRLTH